MENNNTDFQLIKLKDSNKNILYHIPSKKRYLIKNENIDQLYSYMESIRKCYRDLMIYWFYHMENL